ncbi:glycine-rich protein 5-like [Chenopodium quinoa]|uniref:glycine-rich protein 5-like n=1 Tax=Chenopodium quinoa TaxID=63459 RepID=UPI000B771EE8|nr:glycine-rich protein 5-like [Chenopodium quinoa]
MGIRSSFWCVFLVLALVVVLHANAREVPKPKNVENENNEVIVDPKNGPSGTGTKLVNTDTNTIDPTKEAAKGVPKEGGNDVNSDEKNFISFAGVGAAGGIGGVAGVIPIGGLGGFDKGFGAMPFGGLGGSGGGLGGLGCAGGGLGGAGGGLGGAGGGLSGGGCTPSAATSGVVPHP